MEIKFLAIRDQNPQNLAILKRSIKVAAPVPRVNQVTDTTDTTSAAEVETETATAGEGQDPEIARNTATVMKATIARMGLDVTNVAASLAIQPVESTNPTAENKPNQFASATSAAVQAAAQQVLQNRVAEAQQVTGVTLPSFYNPAAVNPMKYAQQIQKRKLLWSNKEKNEPPATSTAKLWEATAFTQDQDGKMTAKFKRLMGIKHDPSEGGPSSSAAVEDQPESAADVLKKQQELFASLDQQYQVARATTHTQRGLGLGFSSNPSYPR
uniref:EOG090X0LFN n=1 Tax=Ceriodaphnia reticulata TaxID=302197 RepID=A0A4Y7LZT8_9CRUS|nr:EOG090X0LFN [Ceriodaphnia reticulata]SVE73342.1 EOG090X0LFN [Ceriodaphnia reticulata]